MQQLRQVKGVIFDLDGTLVESNLNFVEMKRLIGCSSDVDLLSYIENLESDSRKQAEKIVYEMEIEDAQGAMTITGAKQFVTLLQSRKIPIAIVTRNCRDASLIKLESSGLSIDILLTREDAPAKPDPSALLMVAHQWQLLPSEVAYVGDFLYDVEAANSAGMHSVLFAPDCVPDYAHKSDVVFSRYHQLSELFL